MVCHKEFMNLRKQAYEVMAALGEQDRKRLARDGLPKRWQQREHEVSEEETLAWFIRLLNREEPQTDQAWKQVEWEIIHFYKRMKHAPPLPREGTMRSHWAKDLFLHIQLLWQDIKNRETIVVPVKEGTQCFTVREGKLSPSYVSHDP